MKITSQQEQLKGFIKKFEPRRQTLIRAVRKSLRKKFPAANELVYDNYNFFVIGYGATERPSDCFISLTAAVNGVALCFLHGARLTDPKKILQGSGKQTRFIRIEAVSVLERPEINALLKAAVTDARAALPAIGRGKLIIRFVSKKQRPPRKMS